MNSINFSQLKVGGYARKSNEAEDKQVQSIDNEWQTINVQTYCIHGDHENSVAILEYIHQELAKL